MYSLKERLSRCRNAGKLCLLLFLCHIDAVCSDPSSFQVSGPKDSLIIFTGSDWCLPCMRLEKNALSDSIFIDYTRSALVFVQADFPQKKKLTKEEVMRNEILAEQYNKSGVFPCIVVVKNGRATHLPFKNQNAKELIGSIQHILQGDE